MKVLITRRKIERLRISKRNPGRKMKCRICREASLFLSPEEILMTLGDGYFGLINYLTEYDLHFFEEPNGRLLICGNSLIKVKTEGDP